ncbi:MAG TPA: SDR family oxidoreductase [Acidisarcina sp.]
MKIVVVGGTGLIGSKLVSILSEQGHEAVPASPHTGINTVTGDGLAAVLTDAQVIVDVSNSPSFEDQAVMDFFTASTTNLLHYGAKAGVRHLVALSVAGAQKLPDSGYLRAKVAQENIIVKGNGAETLPYSIVHATQFFEFWKAIADLSTQGGRIHLAPVFVQPMAAGEVAKAVARVSLGAPVNRIVEFAGPDRFRFDEFIRRGLKATGDSREVVADPNALYFGGRLSENSLVPAADAELGEVRFDDWLVHDDLKE